MNDPHPVEPQIRARIEATLVAIERDHDVTILYACESGSRGRGFASPDSDYDVRFLYVHNLAWYLTVVPGPDALSGRRSVAARFGGSNKHVMTRSKANPD